VPSFLTFERNLKLYQSSDMASTSTRARGAARMRSKQRVSAKQYDGLQWGTMQGIITQLYNVEKLSMADLLRRLHALGFEVKYVKPFSFHSPPLRATKGTLNKKYASA
jgi:hypothetical protein